MFYLIFTLKRILNAKIIPKTSIGSAKVEMIKPCIKYSIMSITEIMLKSNKQNKVIIFNSLICSESIFENTKIKAKEEINIINDIIITAG